MASYGHIGDGNLHLNIGVEGHQNHDLNRRLETLVHPFVMDYVRKAKGSVSAEHGIGLSKP